MMKEEREEQGVSMNLSNNIVCFRKERGLTQEQLARTLMPVGEYTKEQIRDIAGREGFAVAHKPDSQEICFIPDHDHAAFIEREAGERVPGSGEFCDGAGRGSRAPSGDHALYGRAAQGT